jgi:CRP-like cAMP-binding protein
MSQKIDFKTIRPKLIECEVFEGERNIVLENPVSHEQVILPKSHKKILELLNGEHTVKEMSSLLYNSHGTVNFNAIITAVRLLHESHLLEGVEGEFEEVREERAPHEQNPSILMSALKEFTIFKKVSFKFHHNYIYYALAGAILALVIMKAPSHIFTFNMARFLKSPQGYAEAFPRIIILSSVLFTAKTFMQGLMLLLSVGTFYKFSFRINLFSLSFGLNDNSIYSHTKKDVIVSYALISSLLFFFTTIALSMVLPRNPYTNDLKILSIILTFIEMNPYRKSDLTKIFHFFYAEDQLKSVLPYLKNCSLSGAIEDSNTKLSDEIRYVAYSILAFSWAIAFSLFSIDMIVKNMPGLFFQMQMGSSVSKFSAMGVMGLLLGLFGYLFMDLFHTIIKNVASPILVPLMKFKKSSKEYKKPDISMNEIKKSLSNHMLFNQLSEKTIDYLVNFATLKSVPSKTHLILQGDNSRDVYFIVKGNVDVNVRLETGRVKHVVKLGANTVIGERAIIEECKRTANVTAIDEVVYLDFPESVFKDLLEKEEFKSDADKLKARIEISQFVSSANLFKDFPPEIMNLFVEAGDLVSFPAGHNIVDEGERDKTFYLLIKGKVDVLKEDDKIAELNQGDFFGEIALIANVPRTASVFVREESLFLVIEDRKFWNILSENIELAMYIESVGRSRMQEAA